tara:strand:- start:256 stop:522 length:267 start_codon:yes stop_codon:yes gene_type:complete
MKPFILPLFLLLSFQINTKEYFMLKRVAWQKLQQQFENSNYQMNIILTYFKKNYVATSKKLDILLDSDFDNQECGFTMNFENGIVYSY